MSIRIAIAKIIDIMKIKDMKIWNIRNIFLAQYACLKYRVFGGKIRAYAKKAKGKISTRLWITFEIWLKMGENMVS